MEEKELWKKIKELSVRISSESQKLGSGIILVYPETKKVCICTAAHVIQETLKSDTASLLKFEYKHDDVLHSIEMKIKRCSKEHGYSKDEITKFRNETAFVHHGYKGRSVEAESSYEYDIAIIIPEWDEVHMKNLLPIIVDKGQVEDNVQGFGFPAAYENHEFDVARQSTNGKIEQFARNRFVYAYENPEFGTYDDREAIMNKRSGTGLIKVTDCDHIYLTGLISRGIGRENKLYATCSNLIWEVVDKDYFKEPEESVMEDWKQKMLTTYEVATELQWDNYRNMKSRKFAEESSDYPIWQYYVTPNICNFDMKKRRNQIVIAPNGYGKSSFLQMLYLALTYKVNKPGYDYMSVEEKLFYQKMRKEYFEEDDVKAFFINLNGISKKIVNSSDTDSGSTSNEKELYSLVINKIVNENSLDEDAKKDIDYILRNEKVVLLFDAYDENGMEQNMIGKLHALIKYNANLRMIIASREMQIQNLHTDVVASIRPWKYDTELEIIKLGEYIEKYAEHNQHGVEADEILAMIKNDTRLLQIASVPLIFMLMIINIKKNESVEELLRKIIEELISRHTMVVPEIRHYMKLIIGGVAYNVLKEGRLYFRKEDFIPDINADKESLQKYNSDNWKKFLDIKNKEFAILVETGLLKRRLKENGVWVQNQYELILPELFTVYLCAEYMSEMLTYTLDILPEYVYSLNQMELDIRYKVVEILLTKSRGKNVRTDKQDHLFFVAEDLVSRWISTLNSANIQIDEKEKQYIMKIMKVLHENRPSYLTDEPNDYFRRTMTLVSEIL